MKCIQILKDCSILGGGSTELEFKGGEFYILSDDLLHKLRIIIDHVLGVEIPFKEIYNQYKGQDLNNRKLISLRHGGGGDILFMATGLAELKRKYPKSDLSVAISPAYFPIVENNPDINEVISLPIPLSEWNRFHYHNIFESLIENNPLASKINAYDLFLMKMGLDIEAVPPENKIPKLFITPNEKVDIEKAFPSLLFKRKRVGIQVEASSPIRKYLPHHFVEVGKGLIERGYEVYLFGNHAQENSITYLKGAIGKGVYSIVTDLRQALVVASYMNYFIAPDSLFIHVAGALEIPVIGLYGPFLSELRMKYFKRAIGIDARTNCSPCFRHGHHPCEKGDPSPCLDLITPEIILTAFDELTGEKNE